jgi:hypothetical protein
LEVAIAEAQDLVQKPDAANNPALGEERQALALNWGGRHPRLLQIAARCLWEARQQDRKDVWARHQFEERSQGVPRKLLLVLTGAAKWQQIQDWFQGTKQETQENFK